jgi:aminopeptidase N
LDASDQISFHEAGVPAVQLFSGANADYHRPGDTAEKIDADGLLKVAEVGRQVVEYLAAREQPLSARFASGKASAAQSGGQRKVSLGSIPDFTYQGEGYRLDGVVPGSPAERAGLAKGDVILAIDDTPIGGLRDLSTLLKSLQPGRTIRIRYLRDGEPRSTRAQLTGK